MEGRATGEKGEFMAADYLASMLQFMGIAPAGDKGFTKLTRDQRRSGLKPEELTSYYQNIVMVKYIESSSQISLITNNSELTFQDNVDYSVSSFPNNISFTAQVVFVGYGFTDEKSGYDDFKGVDIKNKIVIILSEFPGYKDKDSEGYKKFSSENGNDYTMERKKFEKAKKEGALGIIILTSNSQRLPHSYRRNR